MSDGRILIRLERSLSECRKQKKVQFNVKALPRKNGGPGGACPQLGADAQNIRLRRLSLVVKGRLTGHPLVVAGHILSTQLDPEAAA